MLARLFHKIFRARHLRRDPAGFAAATLARRTLGAGPLAMLAMFAWRHRDRVRAWLHRGHHASGRSYA